MHSLRKLRKKKNLSIKKKYNNKIPFKKYENLKSKIYNKTRIITSQIFF